MPRYDHRFSRLTTIKPLAALLLGLGVLGLAVPVEAAQPLAGKTIVVDAGHGGRDPGAVANGLREKDITLAIATDLQQSLQAQGAKVVMTRSSDTDLGASTDADLQARVNAAQGNHANAFISVHANFAADAGFTGATTYYGPTCGYYSNVTLSPTDVGRGYSLAQRVESAVVARTGEVNRGAQAQVYWVLGDPGIPSILVETGFISNQGEAGKLANPQYQQAIAAAIADGVNSFFASGDASGSPSAPASALGNCNGQTSPAAQQRWVQTFLPAALLSGTDSHAQTFATLPPFTYLQVLSQQGSFFYVVNPATNGPGFVDASKVGPSGPPPPPPSFSPFWVENFKPVTLWSGSDSKAVSFGTLPPWHFFQVQADSAGPRFLVTIDSTKNVAYVDRANVGPSGPPSGPPPPSAAPAAPPPPQRVTVNSGDTLTAISQRTGVSVADLIAANNLSADGTILAGQTLTIPAGGKAAAAAPSPKKPSTTTVQVQAGDTLSRIAAANGTSVDTLMSLNGLSDPDMITIGQTLRIPS